jgi:hypothetical protein
MLPTTLEPTGMQVATTGNDCIIYTPLTPD